jgi:hypothetical protein
MDMRLFHYLATVFILFLSVPVLMASHAAAQGYSGYPYSIMTPERGAPRLRTEPSRRAVRTRAGQAIRAPAGPHERRNITVARGSSGSVLPTPLPRTPLIPLEGKTAPVIRTAPAQPGVTVVPGINPVPNLPHGTETFQQRASRCAFQQGLYNVPGTLSTQYMGACLQ